MSVDLDMGRRAVEGCAGAFVEGARGTTPGSVLDLKGRPQLRIIVTAACIIAISACSGSFDGIMKDTEKLLLGSPDQAAPGSKPASAPPAQAPTMPAMPGMDTRVKTRTTRTQTTSSAHCCVNGAYYTCGSGADAARCVGKPMQLMSCVQKCGFDSGCEPKCIKQYGPDPSMCQRAPAKDGECKKRR